MLSWILTQWRWCITSHLSSCIATSISTFFRVFSIVLFGRCFLWVIIHLLIFIIHSEIVIQVVSERLDDIWSFPYRCTFAQECIRFIMITSSIFLFQMRTLVFHVLNIMIFENNRFAKCFKFIILKSSIATTINPSYNCNEFLVGGITAEGVHEWINLRMRNVTLSLTINSIKSCLTIPVRLWVEYFLKHFYLDMYI